MLYDRDYMRDGDRSEWRSPVVGLLVVLILVFLLQCFLAVYAQVQLYSDFGLSVTGIARYQFWRLFTYEFLHSAPWPFHLIFNGLGLWFFGRSVWEALGTARFWQVFLGAGFVGGLLELACQAWHPVYGVGPTVGASAGVLGLAGTFCFLFPLRETCFLFYFFPVRLRSMTMFWVLLGFSVFGVLFPVGGVAHAAHLGGLLAGAGFVKLFLDDSARAWWQRIIPRRRARREREEVALSVARGSSRSDRASIPSAEQETPDEFIRREVDPILDKISAHGIQSLTERERRILERARERMKTR